MATLPTTKPVRGPQAMPAMATSPATGLKCGTKAKAARAATARAHRAATSATSRAPGRLRSNPASSGTSPYSTSSVAGT